MTYATARTYMVRYPDWHFLPIRKWEQRVITLGTPINGALYAVSSKRNNTLTTEVAA